jgi:hypothetical protein
MPYKNGGSAAENDGSSGSKFKAAQPAISRQTELWCVADLLGLRHAQEEVEFECYGV